MIITVKTSEYIREFDELCAEYGLSKDGWELQDKELQKKCSPYLTLQMLWVEKKQGQFLTPEEIMADFSVMESAQFLLQLETNKRDVLEVTTQRIEAYESQHFFKISKMMYQDYLDKRVQKCSRLRFLENGIEVEKPAMILLKGYGGGFTGRAFIIPYPEGVMPQKEGWSIEELESIVAYERKMKGEWIRSQGIAKKHSEQKSRRGELKSLIESLLPFVPASFQKAKKYAFVFDYMQHLDFFVDIDTGKNKFKTDSQKYRYIDNLFK